MSQGRQTDSYNEDDKKDDEPEIKDDVVVVLSLIMVLEAAAVGYLSFMFSQTPILERIPVMTDD